MTDFSGGSTRSDVLSIRVEDVSPTLSYIGEACLNANTSHPIWRIRQMDSATGCIITYANGNASFSNIWDDRASYPYS